MFYGKLAFALAGAAALSIAAPAAAQMQLYEDYEPGDGYVEMTTINLEEGQFETYLEGLRTTWIGANEVAKELGHISDYAIYVNTAPTSGTFDLVLVISYPSIEAMAGSREQYMEFLEAYGEANIEQGNETVLQLYNQIREITGTYILREIVVN